eukprot:m.1139224 g.1139224  ORF g.1139224 m.1139224 type:complete len:130 (-) comp24441_c0_seq78:1144-1533(-)
MQSVGRDTAQQNHQCQVARNELALGGSSACCDWPCFALHLPVCTTGAVPQSFGAVQGNGRLPPIAAAALANMSVTEQHSFEGAYAVYKTLPRELARSNTLGTCCISNPAVPAAMGGDCYWTAQDQNACR